MKVISALFAFIVGIVVLVLLFGGTYIVSPGMRGILITAGSLDEHAISPGFGLKMPFVTSVQEMSVQQNTNELKAACFSSDLQQINMTIKVLYRIPEESVVKIYRDYAGNPFDSLIAPRVQEACKEVTANRTASDIVKTREQIKTLALEVSKKKIGTILIVEDIVIENVDLSNELEKAIETKMVQQQQAEQASFTLQKARIDAETQIVKAQADAQSIKIQGEALEKSPQLILLKAVEKWNGVAPQVVGGTSGNLLTLPDVTKKP